MTRKILVYADKASNRDELINLMGNDFEVIKAKSKSEAIKAVEGSEEAIAIMLVNMKEEKPNTTFLEDFGKKGIIGNFPIVIFQEKGFNFLEKAYDDGADLVVKKPFDSNKIRSRINSLIELYSAKNAAIQGTSSEINETNSLFLDMLSTIIEFRTVDYCEHINKIKEITRILATSVAEKYPEYNLTSEKIDAMVSASVMHDIGKIMTPDAVLLKPAKLTAQEFEIMKGHTTNGCEIINSIFGSVDHPYIKLCYEISRWHHERYNGEGYPDRIKGDNIPIHAQIVSIADVYDALISNRIYKKAYSLKDAFNLIINGECGEFNPKLIDCFKASKKKIEAKVNELSQ